MDHSDARALSTVSLQVSLDPAAERDLALHLVSCEQCKAFYDGLHGARKAVQQLIASPPTGESLEGAVGRGSAVLVGDPDPSGPVPTANFEDVVVLPPAPDPKPEPEESFLGLTSESAAEAAPPEPVRNPPIRIGSTALEAPRAEIEIDEVGPPPPIVPGAHVRVVTSNTEPVYVPPLPVGDDDPDFLKGPTDDFGEDPPRGGAAKALIAALVLATLAAGAYWYFKQTPQRITEPSSPSAAKLISTMNSRLENLENFDADYSHDRLDLFNYRDASDKQIITFTQARKQGHLTWDRRGQLSETAKLEIPKAQPVTTTTILNVSSYVATSRVSQTAVLDAGPAYGPPASSFRSNLGAFEQGFAWAIGALREATNVKVGPERMIGKTTAWEVEFSVPADDVSRADRVTMFVAKDGLPLRVIRTISRANAGVLGSNSIITDDILDRAFKEREELTSDDFSISNFDPLAASNSDFEFPTGSAAADSGWRPGVLATVSFPGDLPEGFKLTGHIRASKLTSWGPIRKNGTATYPAAISAEQFKLSDGLSTVVVDHRVLASGVKVSTSPFANLLFPLVTQTATADGVPFTFSSSPETPPTIWGQVGSHFYTVSGWVPKAVLEAVLAGVAKPSTVPTAAPATPKPSPRKAAVATSQPKPKATAAQP